MSQASPEAEFTPALADELLRRAVAIDEARQELVTLASVKETLATLGVQAETVDRAAAEMLKESGGWPGLAFTLVLGAGFWMITSIPGLFCISLAIAEEGFWRWTLGWAGGLWTLFMFAAFLDVVLDEVRALRKSQGDA